MEREEETHQYPLRLQKYILQNSVEKHNFFIAVKEWEFLFKEDTEKTESKCPCGKNYIRYLCHIYNYSTKVSIQIGSECIKWFDEKLVDVFDILKTTTLNCKFHGYDKFKRPLFRLKANQNLVKKNAILDDYFDRIPIWKTKGNKWLLATQSHSTVYQIGSLTTNSEYTITFLFRVSKIDGKSLVIEIQNIQ